MANPKRDSKKQQGGRKSRRHGRKSAHKSAHKSARHTRKAERGLSWPQFVKKTYEKMKKDNKNATFKEAMIKASELKKRGEF